MRCTLKWHLEQLVPAICQGLMNLLRGVELAVATYGISRPRQTGSWLKSVRTHAHCNAADVQNAMPDGDDGTVVGYCSCQSYNQLTSPSLSMSVNGTENSHIITWRCLERPGSKSSYMDTASLSLDIRNTFATTSNVGIYCSHSGAGSGAHHPAELVVVIVP